MTLRTITFILLFAATAVRAQILPREGSLLNYRLVGFSAGSGVIEVAQGRFLSADSFAQKKIMTIKAGAKGATAFLPQWNADYTWRVTRPGKEKNTPLYHFRIAGSTHIDTALQRLHIFPHSSIPADEFVFSEAGGVLYDLGGAPVWFAPDTAGVDGNISCVNFTPDGTLTFIYYKSAYEMTLGGKLLWKSPDTDIVTGKPAAENYYHHDFRKTSRGHYMILGTELMKCKTVMAGDSLQILTSTDLMREGYRLARFGAIIEYDSAGKVVWSWQSSGYLLRSDFAYFNPADSPNRYEPHDNSFWFDERAHCIYVGFRNLNRIIRIGYPDGQVQAVYGESFKPGVTGNGAGLLCNQHGVFRTSDGLLGCFNNNSCRNTDSLPSVILMKEPAAPGAAIKKVWDFTCPVEPGVTLQFTRGGNVVELPGRKLFICLAGNYSKMMIAGRNKKVTWSAIAETRRPQEKQWKPAHGYRAAIISRQELDKLVWRAEKE